MELIENKLAGKLFVTRKLKKDIISSLSLFSLPTRKL